MNQSHKAPHLDWCSSRSLLPVSHETCRVLPVAMSETDGCESPIKSPISVCVMPDRISASTICVKSMGQIIGLPMIKVNRKTDVKLRDHAAMETNDTPSTFGQRLKVARKAAKISQAKLAVKVGMSQPTLSELECDLYPSSTFTPRLAEALRVSSVWLADGRGRKERTEPSAGALQTEGEAGHHEQPSNEHRAECLTAAIRSMLEGAGLEPDRLGTEQELRTKLGDDPPPPDPHRLPHMNNGQTNLRSPKIERG